MRLLNRIICPGLILLLAASAPALAADKTVATVNGKKISEKQLDQFASILQKKNPRFDPKSNRQAIINQLVNREVLLQEAKKLDKNNMLTEQIKMMQQQMKKI